MNVASWMIVLLGSLATVPCSAQVAGPLAAPNALSRTDTQPRAAVYRLNRSEEDWSFLSDPAERTEAWDGLKYVPLGRVGWYVSFGGEGRLFYESYRNYNWGAGPQDDNGFVLSRAMGHANVHLGRRARVFVELKSGLLAGRNGGPRPPDEDRLDLAQGFVDMCAAPHANESTLSLRVGRQELAYGEGALVAIRELNVRRPFDGVRLRYQSKGWRLDSFVTRPATTRQGIFDDASDSTQLFWGLYATISTDPDRRFRELGLYYLGLDREQVRFEQDAGPELRHTIGATLQARTGPLSHYAEGTLQWGELAEGSLRAWKYAHAVRHDWPTVRFKPTVGVNVAVSSGDSDPDDERLQTFHPLFPKGLYYGHIDDSGSLNAIVVHPQVTLQVARSVSLHADTFMFWRQRLSDGLYSQPGTFLRPGSGVSGRHVGWLQDIEITWRLDPHTTLQFLSTYYTAGAFLRASALPGEDIAYAGLKISYRF
jgi:hypothetical protein